MPRQRQSRRRGSEMSMTSMRSISAAARGVASGGLSDLDDIVLLNGVAGGGQLVAAQPGCDETRGGFGVLPEDQVPRSGDELQTRMAERAREQLGPARLDHAVL